jgi:hypothetical protein
MLNEQYQMREMENGGEAAPVAGRSKEPFWAPEWSRVTDELPEGEVLVWSSGRAVVGSFLADEFGGEERRSCMDGLATQILDWPTHWMPVPSPPGFE